MSGPNWLRFQSWMISSTERDGRRGADIAPHHAREKPPTWRGLVTVIGPRPSGRLDERAHERPGAASRRTTDVPDARRTSRKRRYAELKGVIDVLVSLPVLTGRKLAPRLLQPGCCGVVGSGPSATRDSRHTVARVTKRIIAPMPAGWHRLVRFNPCSCFGLLWPVREQLSAPRQSEAAVQPCSTARADSPSIVCLGSAKTRNPRSSQYRRFSRRSRDRSIASSFS